MPLLSPWPVDAGLAVGATWTAHPSLELAGSVPLRFTSNEAFAAFGPALELRARPGWQGERWALRAELGASWAPLAYVAPTETYREHQYSEARAGWVGLASLSARLGARAALRVTDTLGVELSGGVAAPQRARSAHPPAVRQRGPGALTVRTRA